MRFHVSFAAVAILMALSLMPPGSAQAQKVGDKEKKAKERPQGIFETRREYEEFIGGLKKLRDPEVNAMLPVLNDLALGRPIGKTATQYGGSGSPVMTLLADKRIRQELEVVDDQVSEIQRLNRELQERLSIEVRSLDLTNPAQVVATIRNITETAQSKMENVILPHQLDRLKQLGIRDQMNRQGVLGALMSDPLASELEITDEQMDELQQSAKAIETELAREIEELKIEARKKMFATLNRTQQQKLDDLIGDEFRFRSDATGINDRPRSKINDGEKPKKTKLEKKKPRL